MGSSVRFNLCFEKIVVTVMWLAYGKLCWEIEAAEI